MPAQSMSLLQECQYVFFAFSNPSIYRRHKEIPMYQKCSTLMTKIIDSG